MTQHNTPTASIQIATRQAIPTAITIAPRGYSFHGDRLQKDDLGSVTPQEPYSLREQRLLEALQAIVKETMAYPPAPPFDGDSFLPAHMVLAAQKALGAYGAYVPQKRRAA